MKSINNIFDYRRFNYLELIFEIIKISFSVISIFAKMNLINAIFEPNNGDPPVNYLVQIIFCYVMIYVFSQLSSLVKIYHKRKYKFFFTAKFFDKLYSLPVQIMESQPVQNLSEKIQFTHEKAQDFSKIFHGYIEIAIISAVLVILLLAEHTLFTIALIAIFGLIFFINIVCHKNTKNFWGNYMKNVRRFNYLSDVMTRRDFAYEGRTFKFSQFINDKFNTEFEAARKNNRVNALIRFRFQALAESLIICVTVFSLIYFIEPLSLGFISIGAYVAIAECIAIILTKTSETSEEFYKVGEYISLTKEADDFFKTEQTGMQKNEHSLMSELLVLKNIYFSYDGKADVLKDISFSFQPKKHYGIVGVNGSGKSSLMNIALGLYIPHSGQIMHNCKPFMIFQDFCQYPVTVKEYVLLGNCPNTPDELIFEALGKVRVLDDVMMLKFGIETPLSLISEDGTLLSKGQLQKLTVARAFLSKNDLIIFDEPTSSLDPVAERDVYNECRALLRDKTVLFISHRLGAIKNVDEILVIEEGQIKEVGSHSELMSKGGNYQKLYETQRGLYDV